MGTSFKISLLILQCFVWSVLLLFPYLNKPPGIDHYLWNFHLQHLTRYFLLILFFNLNYFYFVPALFQKQKFISYSLYIILSFMLLIGVETLIAEYLFPKITIVEFRLHLLSSGYLLITYATSTTFRALEDWFVHNKEKKVLISEKQKAELATLRHQLSPHFLFNTLNNISELMHQDVDIAEDYIAKLSSLLRELLSKENTDKISLEKELRFVQNYVDLQKIRLNKINTLDFKIDGSADSLFIEPFILINFIENVFKHGLSNKDTRLLIHIQILDKTLFLKTENKISSSTKDDSRGIGLHNVQKRLNILYPHKNELSISQFNNYYSVNLKIDLA